MSCSALSAKPAWLSSAHRVRAAGGRLDRLDRRRGQPVGAVGLGALRAVAEHMVVRAVLHHHDDDVVDLREVGRGPGIADEGRHELRTPGSHFDDRAPDRAVIAGARARVVLERRDMLEHQRPAFDADRSVAQVRAEDRHQDARRQVGVREHFARARCDAAVEHALEQFGKGQHAERDQRPGDRAQAEHGAPMQIDVERGVRCPAHRLRGAVGCHGDADFHLQAAAAYMRRGDRRGPELDLGLAGHPDRQPHRRHGGTQADTGTDDDVDRAYPQGAHVDRRAEADILGAARQRVDDVGLDVVLHRRRGPARRARAAYRAGDACRSPRPPPYR